MHYIYILRCADNTLYVGETGDVVARVLEHEAGEASAFTRTRRPVTHTGTGCEHWPASGS